MHNALASCMTWMANILKVTDSKEAPAIAVLTRVRGIPIPVMLIQQGFLCTESDQEPLYLLKDSRK